METVNIFGLEFDYYRYFTIPGTDFKIYWYGVLIAIGFALALIYGLKRAKSFGISSDRLIDCIIVTAPCAILGARFYYVLFYNHDFSTFFDFRDGGLAILGAVIVAVIVGALMCKLRKVNILSALDLAALGFLIGQAIGRWGNFINQEAFGTATGSDWFGMTGNIIVEKTGSTALVHPCFLYESLWCFIGFLLLHFLSKKRAFNGQIAALYMVWYGLGRAVIEGLRTDSLMIGDFIRVSQLLSILMVIAGAIWLAVGLSWAKRKKQEETYAPVFDIDELDIDASDIADNDKKEETDAEDDAQRETDIAQTEQDETDAQLEAESEEKQDKGEKM